MDAREYRPEPDITIPAAGTPTPSSRGSVRRGWELVQTHTGGVAALAEAVSADLAGGADGVRIDVSGLADPAELVQVLGAVDWSSKRVVLAWADEPHARVLAGLPEGSARLDFGLDPVGFVARAGGDAAAMTARIERALRVLDGVGDAGQTRVFTADDTVWHDAGATEAVALGLQVATVVALVRRMESAGVPIETAFAQITLRSAMPGRFVLGAAKLRAARRLVRRVGQLAGVEVSMEQTATAAWRESTRRDPWVNILRGTTAAFAGVVGGAAVIDVPPYAAGAEARRLARNTSLVLRDESQLARVADPGGGSDVLESLTDQLAQATWAEVQAVEAEGGVEAALASGWIHERIRSCRRRLESRVRTRKAAILGVSRFPALDEELPAAAPAIGPVPREGADIAPLARHRNATPFEALRKNPAWVALVTAGPLAEHTARTGFGRELLGAGGLKAVELDLEVATPAAQESGVAVLSMADSRFGTDAPTAVKRLTEAGVAVWMLGAPREHEGALREAGVRDFIVAGGDALATLDALRKEVQR